MADLLLRLNERAAEVLAASADATEKDERGAKAAVATLWSRLHADREAIRVVFDALAAAAGVSDVTGYLGPVLQKLTPIERAQLCRQAAAELRLA